MKVVILDLLEWIIVIKICNYGFVCGKVDICFFGDGFDVVCCIYGCFYYCERFFVLVVDIFD